MSLIFSQELFNDNETAEQILQTKTPGDCKDLGRRVKGFDEAIWTANRTRIVSNALLLKVRFSLLLKLDGKQ